MTNDPDLSYHYVLNFLMQFYSDVQIVNFDDQCLQCFIQSVLTFKGTNATSI